MDERRRCAWARDESMVEYHDTEWGTPTRGTRALFELLVLEGAQAGLSWATILGKRDGYRRAFAGFDPARVAGFEAGDVDRLVGDPGIVRHRGKIESAIVNARAVMAVRETHGDFGEWIWSLVSGAPRTNRWRTVDDVPSATPESAALSRALKREGFRFVGPTTCYAFMQAAGIVNDHTLDCFRHAEVERAGAPA